MEKVIVELITASQLSGAALLGEIESSLPGLQLDPNYPPVEMAPRDPGQAARSPGDRVIVVRGLIAPVDKAALKNAAGVQGVWSDGPVAPFADGEEPR